MFNKKNLTKINTHLYGFFPDTEEDIKKYDEVFVDWKGLVKKTEPKSSKKEIEKLNKSFKRDVIARISKGSQLREIKGDKKNIFNFTEVKLGLKKISERCPVLIKRKEFDGNFYITMEYANPKGDFLVRRDDFGEYKKGYDTLVQGLENFYNTEKPKIREYASEIIDYVSGLIGSKKKYKIASEWDDLIIERIKKRKKQRESINKI